jgi:hypothetical protein
MTENDETPTDEEQYRPTLGETSHTNPFTGEVFGDTQTYSRGTTIAADGGEADAVPEEPETDEDGEVLRDIDHTPPEGAESANAVHARGGEAEGVPETSEE